MKYVANPVEVDAWQIAEVRAGLHGYYIIILDDGGKAVTVTPQMTARMTPKVGDYYVVQSDGYAYLNPKDVFERNGKHNHDLSDTEKLAFAAYSGYSGGSEWKSLVSGEPLPAWDKLPEKIKLAWQSAAEMVKTEIVRKV